MSRNDLLALIDRRIAAASQFGKKDEAAYEACRILDAIEDHTENPRDFSAAFIVRQWMRIESIMCAT